MPNSYKSLSDCPLFKEGDEVEVWYMNEGFFSDGIMGNSGDIDPKNLNKTHVLLGTIDGFTNGIVFENEQIADRLFFLLQGERWSSNGEARELILDKGLFHTSMSVVYPFIL